MCRTEDDQATRILMQKTLKDENMTILYAYNRHEGVEHTFCQCTYN